MGSSLLRLLTLYAIWGKGTVAASLRATGIMFLALGIQFMICFWLWSLSPWFMTFAIPVVYVSYLYLEKSRRVYNFQREEAERRELDGSRIKREIEESNKGLPKTSEDWRAWSDQQSALRQQDARRTTGIDPRTHLGSGNEPK